jgi:hypothetical protein
VFELSLGLSTYLCRAKAESLHVPRVGTEARHARTAARSQHAIAEALLHAVHAIECYRCPYPPMVPAAAGGSDGSVNTRRFAGNSVVTDDREKSDRPSNEPSTFEGTPGLSRKLSILPTSTGVSLSFLPAFLVVSGYCRIPGLEVPGRRSLSPESRRIRTHWQNPRATDVYAEKLMREAFPLYLLSNRMIPRFSFAAAFPSGIWEV